MPLNYVPVDNGPKGAETNCYNYLGDNPDPNVDLPSLSDEEQFYGTANSSSWPLLNFLFLCAIDFRVLLTSTSEVYGDPLEHPQTEEYWRNVNPIGVRSCYGEGKRVAETLMFDYHRQHGIEIKIARIFNTYGLRMNIDDGRVVSNFLAQAIRGEHLTVQAPGTQTRSFCYVSDMVSKLLYLSND
ncbi:UDP-glucuronic acid decarboxylase 1 [Rhynchospora pubera]|uniref:UDP-glucuronic acid decarboxylase 1 n=1 Tax=Rhynchospora pubera TaxID=906938 RepID=A0AAV8HP54_9POAL|nr:UDP-glucuronic acid decarboxylase 1 [Rhynchospora pubera]